jgi:hypothetical protein
LKIAHQSSTSRHYAWRRHAGYTFEQVKNANTLNVITFIKLHCTLFRDALAISRAESFGVLHDQNGGVVGSDPARIHPQMLALLMCKLALLRFGMVLRDF